jgi:citrate synthase
MSTEAAAMAAVEALNGELFGGAFITVSKAREDEEALADSSRMERSPRTSFSKLF